MKGLVPTFFMQALGVAPFQISRTAVAGYRQPIALGQPRPQLGATVSQLGAGQNFYFLRFKGWNNNRSEGDAFTTNPQDPGPWFGTPVNTSDDVHAISQATNNEDAEVQVSGTSGSLYDGACFGGTASTTPSVTLLPCRGGYNFRIVVPQTDTDIQVDVYNMAFAPDFGTNHNKCDNLRTPVCNPSGYGYAEEDSGNYHCTTAATCSASSDHSLQRAAALFGHRVVPVQCPGHIHSPQRPTPHPNRRVPTGHHQLGLQQRRLWSGRLRRQHRSHVREREDRSPHHTDLLRLGRCLR